MLVNAISQAVTTGLKLISQPTYKGGAGTNGTEFASKPYLGKPQPSQLAPGADGSLTLDLECQYWKDTSHLKDNCIKLNHQLAMEQKKLDPNVAPTTHASTPSWQTRDSFVYRTGQGSSQKWSKILLTWKMF